MLLTRFAASALVVLLLGGASTPALAQRAPARKTPTPAARPTPAVARPANPVTAAPAPAIVEPAPAPAPLPFVASDESHSVLAYYYAWWGPSDFDHTLFQAAQPYNSDDSAIMQQHIQEAQAAGVDGFIMSWYGNGDRTDRNLSQLLDLGTRTGFHTTIHFETPHFWGVDDVVAQLRAFYDMHLSHPALVHYQGRPVIFFWRVSTFDNGTWSAIRNAVDPGHAAVWIADGDDFNVLRGDAWDGISPYAIAWSGNPAGQLPSWGAKAQAVAPDKLYIPPVSPGCNDSTARTPTCIQDRAGGGYYQATWDGAMAAGPTWAVTVSTFNEWLESTQIEPSVQYGDQYLQITRQNADAFHAPAASPDSSS
jgi:glycosyl hydrolase family 99